MSAAEVGVREHVSGPTLVAVETDPDVDAYIERSPRWHDEIRRLRPVLVDCGLTEAFKWGKPCYTHNGKNIVIVQEMKDFLALMFFKGALLDDPRGMLEAQGPNSRSARRMRFTSVGDVEARQDTVVAFVEQAVAVEEAGMKVGPAPAPTLARELRQRLDEDPTLAAAFSALTPGRQREYNLYIAGAKQSKTRAARIERCTDKILAGKGLRDR